MSARTVTVNSRELADLQLVINAYESKISKESNGQKSMLLAYRPLENTEINFKTTYESIDPQDKLGKGFADAKRGLQDLNDAVSDSTVGAANNLIKSIYEPGSFQNREEVKLDLGPITIKTQNTVSSMIQAFEQGDLAKGFSILANDCIPCDLRFEALNFTPNLNFLEQLSQQALEFVDQIKSLIDNLMNTDNLKVDLCAQINLLNFTCVPDLNALLLALQKGLTITLTLPKFTLPGLGELVSMILTPILATMANLVQAWMSMIIAPMDCLLKSLQTIILKYKLPDGKTSKTGASITPNTSTVDVNLNLDFTLDKESTDAFNSRYITNVVLALEKIRVFLHKIKDRIVSFMNKLVEKFHAAMNNGLKSLFNCMNGLKEVMKITAMIQLISLIKAIANSQLESCNSKEEAIPQIYDEAAKRINEAIPGNSIVEKDPEDNSVRLSMDVNLTPPEAAALGFAPTNPSISNNPLFEPSSQNPNSKGFEDSIRVSVASRIKLGSCKAISNREQFISVDRLVNSF